MISKFLNVFRIEELRKKLFFTASILLVYRLGGMVPLPGIDTKELNNLTQSVGEGGILNLYDIFVGGFLSQASIFALGIMPYISASIILQLLGAVLPYYQKLQKEGELGRRKITAHTRYFTVIIAIIQSFGIATFFSQGLGVSILIDNYGNGFFYFTSMPTLVTGTVFVMWLGEQITANGIGNGLSLIIATSIIAGIPSATGKLFNFVKIGQLNILTIVLFIIIMLVILYSIVFVERSFRKIPIQYPQKTKGRKVFAGQSSHLPLKINPAGVIPPIFASSLLLLPLTIFSYIDIPSVNNFAQTFLNDNFFYNLIFAILVIFFTFFYTGMVIKPEDMSDNLKKGGAFIPGIRPGKNTTDYIKLIMSKLTVIGALYLAIVCIIPAVLNAKPFSLPFYFGGTSLLIVIGVTLDTIQQIETFLIGSNYDQMSGKKIKKEPSRFNLR